MNSVGLIAVLSIAVLVGLIFGIDADLDLGLSRPFYEFTSGPNVFALGIDPVFMMTREFVIWGVTALAAPAVATLAFKLVRPRARLLMSARAMLFLLATLVLGPGLLVNLTLKEHGGRPRPANVVQFEGTDKFVAWWDPRGDCVRSCSFVSGDVSAAYWTVAAAALAPPAWRALAYGGAIAFGVAVSALRLAVGAHFFTDVAFAGVFMFLIVWVVHGAIYRWPRTRLSDDDIESEMERAQAWWLDILLGLVQKRAPRADP